MRVRTYTRHMTNAARGRPRSESVRRSILEAARDLIAERGYQQLSFQAIATRSGCGRQTIYRWWASKALIVADLVLEGQLTLPQQPVPDTGSLDVDLTEWLERITASLRDPAVAALTRALISAASDDQGHAQLLYAMTTGPYHQGLVDRLARGQSLGQLREAADPAALADALIGTVLFRTLIAGAQPAGASAVIRALTAP
ncbi:TetR/AcrR family transcriptional regulator [Cryobacterium sp. MDB2-10]|uniref:TetR/AcrR family transcriptional regulator n=2 Tax=Microbacteriaceae TaxID=85023 RepID=A0ABY2IL42_9MICO|nr:TetR/AcrR family transcriptional regulator [Cryobacterium sp. MDB2-A-1]TFC04993.1 TetR/AcrR family transcriptional regulator [Cryobacterium sp. MDB2-33-2]TFC10635.1 TetR/AcrR family transcriptional regulator [Cryobacterium sp. MDB2-A-2]TFC17275.1 TetR/AcrR family transcriptional regulator [Cryobacterium glucosi]TFC21604.1 TetR/AcrR family transcriptional regulator [Cryobacterium sp. MDB2-10]